MATYKVLQDIEAEDTLIGPLTVRQCLYAAVAIVAGYLSFLAIVKHAPFLVLFFLPFMLFGLFFAFPWSKQQPTEIWALAKIRFYFKPRKRIWNQTGVREMVTITAPKVVKKTYTNNLSPGEVKSRLKALADTIDSRGWAVKNVDLGYYRHDGTSSSSDRLLSATALPSELSSFDAPLSSDIFDVQNNPLAQKFDVMMTQAGAAHRQQLLQQMAQPAGASAAPGQGMAYGQVPVQAGGAQLPAPADYWHMRTIQPMGGAQFQAPSTPASAVASYGSPQSGQAQQVAQAGQQPAVTPVPNPAILELASNNDLNVATIAREAQARSHESLTEVIVPLH